MSNFGNKEVNGKAPWHLLPFDALNYLVKVYAFGCIKYSDRNWENGVPYSQCIGAFFRHFFAFITGEKINEESGLPHVAHMCWWALALLTFEVRGMGTKEDKNGIKLNDIEGIYTPDIDTKEVKSDLYKVFQENNNG